MLLPAYSSASPRPRPSLVSAALGELAPIGLIIGLCLVASKNRSWLGDSRRVATVFSGEKVLAVRAKACLTRSAGGGLGLSPGTPGKLGRALEELLSQPAFTLRSWSVKVNADCCLKLRSAVWLKRVAL